MSSSLRKFIPLYAEAYYHDKYIQTQNLNYALVASRFYRSPWAKAAIIDATDHYIDTWAHTNRKPSFPVPRSTPNKKGRTELLYIPETDWDTVWGIYLKVKTKQCNKAGALYTVHNAAKELYNSSVDDDSSCKVLEKLYRACKPILAKAWEKHTASQEVPTAKNQRNNTLSPFVNDSIAYALRNLPSEKSMAEMRRLQKDLKPFTDLRDSLPKGF